ncbi:glycosyltransferase family 4 protein [Patescibacteria group bacterium]|nr:glycosyltransferase family 4 protein [Patescibacteria group bacterium]MCL5091702.1 glycosyltransferase family 4 protein [Patescibacteria group bacterium]
MKKIGIDARLYFQTGVGVYIRNLVRHIDPKASSTQYFIYVLKKDLFRLRLPKGLVIRPVTSYWHSLAEQTVFLRQLQADRLDLVHFPYFSYPVLYRRPFVATIHDLTPLLYRTGRASTRHPFLYWLKYLVFRAVLRTQVGHALKIITPTQAVKAQLVSVYGEAIKDKITVVYEGVNSELLQVEEAPLTKVAPPFFLYVGNFYPHKNLGWLVKEFAQARTKAKLLLIGPPDHFSFRLRQLISQQHQTQRIFLLENASLGNLVYAYRHALALIHPSRSEGFGLPIVEAMHFRLPVMASDIPVFRELLGNQSRFFDPGKTGELRPMIEAIRVRRPVIYQNLERFSFADMAVATLQIYQEVLSIISS